MIKALLLIFAPIPTWDRIVRSQRRLGFILGMFLLPLLLVTCAWEGFGMSHWGKLRGSILPPKLFPVGEIAIFQLAQLGVSLSLVFIGASLIKAVGETFHGRHSYGQAFTVVAYSLGPLFLLHLLDAFREVSPWVAWSIGITLSIATLYHGLPRLLQPDPSHAFGLFLMSAMLLALTTGLARFVTAWYLQGRFTKLESLVVAAGARLHF